MVDLTGSKFIVTGGAGFIGSHICEEIVKQGKRVICIDDFRNSTRENLRPWWDPSLCTMVSLDVKSPEIERYFSGVDVVFHNAASKCTVCRQNPKEDLLVNAFGSLNVFQCAIRAGAKVVHASTGSVNHGDPHSFYGVSKQAGESYLGALRCYHPDFKYSILRYYHVYGTRQDDSAWGGVIPIFIRRYIEGQPICIHGDGHQVRHFTHVDDVVSANFLVANSDEAIGEVYDVVSDTRMSILELAYVFPVEFVHDLERPGDIRSFQVDNTKIKSLGLEFKYGDNRGFLDGLRETLDWYQEREERKHERSSTA